MRRCAGGCCAWPARTGGPGIVAALAGDRINLGDLLAIYALTQTSGNGEEPGLSNHDLDIDLRAGEFQGLGLVAKSVDANFRIESGEITINRLKAGDFYGVSIDSAGRLSDLLGAPSGSFRLKAAGANAAALAELAGRHWPGIAILTQTGRRSRH